MSADVELCDLCALEGLEPTDDDMDVWDGATYPSYRRHRTMAPNPQLYEVLFQVATGGITSAQRSFM